MRKKQPNLRLHPLKDAKKQCQEVQPEQQESANTPADEEEEADGEMEAAPESDADSETEQATASLATTFDNTNQLASALDVMHE